VTNRKLLSEAKLWLVAIPVLLWTLIPIYHIFLFSISTKDSAFSGRLWPKEPTLHNFGTVFTQNHFYLHHFWNQIWNSLWIAVAAGAITLAIATCAAFAISRLKVRGGRTVMNAALFTYFIPAAFLAVPMYKAMGTYGLLNSRWSLVLAMVTIAAPYAIWVLKQASDKLPWELDEAARIDGATPMQLFRLVYLPLMVPSLVAIFTYALLLTWNEYLYAFLLLSHENTIPLAVGLGHFLSSDDSPWEILMATALVYGMPPAAIYYAFRRYMVGGLTAERSKADGFGFFLCHSKILRKTAVLHGISLEIDRRRVHGAGRPLGLRQVDAAAHARRPGGHHRRRDRDRRTSRERPRLEGPRRRHGVPELRALSAHARAREHGLFAKATQGTP
jgi:multiple sugar transport system permease protein